MKVATAGQCVKATSSAMAGRSRSQPWTVAVARALIASRIADPGKKRDYADEIPYRAQEQSGKMPASGDQSGKMPACFPSAPLCRTREDDDDLPRAPASRRRAIPPPEGRAQAPPPGRPGGGGTTVSIGQARRCPPHP